MGSGCARLSSLDRHRYHPDLLVFFSMGATFRMHHCRGCHGCHPWEFRHSSMLPRG
jgi:hypothetical protein